jgi:hypothetical protein
MSSYERIVQRSVVDMHTGEIIGNQLEKTTDIFKRSDEDGFIKLYLNDLAKLSKVQHKAMLVLFELLKIMDYHNEISVSIGKKKDICKALDIYNLVNGEKILGTNIVDQHIFKLIKIGLLMRKDKGMYIANPSLFGKGKWNDIKEIRMSISYSEDGRMIKSEINKI